MLDLNSWAIHVREIWRGVDRNEQMRMNSTSDKSRDPVNYLIISRDVPFVFLR